MKKLLFVVAFILAANAGMAQDAAFKADVKKLLQLSGANAQLEVAKKQVTAMIPAAKQTEFAKEYEKVIQPAIEAQEKFYLTEFTPEDVKQIIKFYESPVGKKIAEKATKQAESNMQTMQEMGMEMQGLMMKYMQ